MQTIPSNSVFAKAASFVRYTDRSVFLTGKAGTGKTTFLRYISQHCAKKMAIVAPTGVAAIQAGGTTIHSLFWLPFGTFISDYDLQWNDEDNAVYNRRRLLSKLRLTSARRTLLQELELLIVDEASMLRADMLDAINVILQSVRRDQRPFGHVQMVFIGDLYQLPPVVKHAEWKLMQSHYKSPFFFDAHVLKEFPLVQLELTEVYRQRDETFIHLLNDIRKNRCDAHQLSYLNTHYQPEFRPAKNESYIILCSHNAQADNINQQKLQELHTPSFKLQAKVQGSFMENAFPTEPTLLLKKGAQVMFIKNDKGETRRYYNGKIGIIDHISSEGERISILCPDEKDPIIVEREEWQNIQYQYDTKTDKIKEEILGTFSQFPLRLAWAVTIHKSQGLTFERAIIDAGSSFAAGQVYVALSRVRSLKGLVLRSAIHHHNIFVDPHVNEFSKKTLDEHLIDSYLKDAQEAYLITVLTNSFDWDKESIHLKTWRSDLSKTTLADKDAVYYFLTNLINACDNFAQVGQKFRNQLQQLFSNTPPDLNKISKRTQQAATWFSQQIEEALLIPIEDHIKAWKVKKRSKKHLENTANIFIHYKRKKLRIDQCISLTRSLAHGKDLPDLVLQLDKLHNMEIEDILPPKKEKGESRLISLQLYKEGKAIAEIAKLRGLANTTIVGHLIDFIGKEVPISDFITETKLKTVLQTIHSSPQSSAKEIKERLGGDFSYVDIRIGQKIARTNVEGEV